MMPVAVVVGSIIYRISSTPGDWMRIEHKVQSKGDYGHTDNLLATIYINPDSTPDVARLTSGTRSCTHYATPSWVARTGMA